jgi:hypothetical protein
VVFGLTELDCLEENENNSSINRKIPKIVAELETSFFVFLEWKIAPKSKIRRREERILSQR